MKILLLSAYDAASHQRWRLDLEQHFPAYQWTALSLPPRYFSWRIRGNSLSWAFGHREILMQDYALLIATSMVDLSALRGFIPSLARVPTLVYFHENQFAYPVGEEQFNSVEPQVITLYSALCADKLLFNSAFNRGSFLDGAAALLQRLPDHVPLGLIERLIARSDVLPVPLAENLYIEKPKKADQLFVVWNHRWEYDKGPERLLAMLQMFFFSPEFSEKLPRLKVHVVGQQFRQQPAAFTAIKSLLQQHDALGQWGYQADVAKYRELLRESHIVLSTAIHDFQGLSVLEAVAAGCIPLVPARQVYPEWFGEPYCYRSDVEHPAREARDMAQALHTLAMQFEANDLPPAPDISAFSWTKLGANYQQQFQSLIAVGAPQAPHVLSTEPHW